MTDTEQNDKPDKPEKDTEEKCAICGEPLIQEEWFDDEEYGDCHTRCLREKGAY